MTATPIHPAIEQTFESELCRAVVFTVGNHYLALPLTAVLKVVPRSVMQSDYAENQPVVYLENQPLTLLNLYTCLSSVSGSHPVAATSMFTSMPTNVSASMSTSVPASVPKTQSSGQLLLIVGLAGYPQWAIPVDQPPTLMELPLSTVRLLPTTYRQRIHDIACHVAVLTNPQELLTILLLNLRQAAIALSQAQN